MDKKPTISILKSEIDKLRTSFKNEKQEKDDTINQILSVVDNLGKSLSAYSNDDVEGGVGGAEAGGAGGFEYDEKFKTLTTQTSDQITQLTQKIEKMEELFTDRVEKLSTAFQEELKKKDSSWQQKYDVMVHKLTCQINSVNSNRYVLEEMNKTGKPLLIKFAPLTPNAQKPMRGSEYSAGIDLRSAYEYLVPANGNKLIKTDWKVQYPDGYFGKICSRSGLSLNHNIEVGAGIVDADWCGSVNVVLNNLSGRDFHVSVGDRIAQLVCTPYITPQIVYCNPDDISNTERGENGFGSTGIN